LERAELDRLLTAPEPETAGEKVSVV